jgi:predicted dehydrogenase
VLGAERRAFDLDDLGEPEGIVIASPTVFHADHLGAALETGARIMVEKPLARLDDNLDAIVRACGDRVMVAYNLRLHEPLERFVELVDRGHAGVVHAARVWFGSWLPDWRPEIDYRTTYSARSDLGGGVLLDAIHELDEIVWIFGNHLEVMSAFVDRVGPLEIDVEDTVRALMRLPSGAPVDVSLDYLSRRYRRGIEVIGSEATIRYDWATSELSVDCATDLHAVRIDTPLDAAYQREAARFLSFVRNDLAPPVGAATGAESVRLARRIREIAAR